MFGIYRFILSLAVAQAHLWEYGWAWPAHYAVFSFYTLSGFLITTILHDTYGFTWQGLKTFAINRFLRIYIIYYAIAFIFIFYLIQCVTFQRIWNSLSWETILIWIIIIGQAGITSAQTASNYKHAIVSNSWSLSIEIVCYILLAIGFAKTAKRLWLFLLLGVLSVIVSCFFPRADEHFFYFDCRYGVIEAGFIPFACGGLCYFYYPFLKNLTRIFSLPYVILLWVTIIIFGYFSEINRDIIGLYFSIILTLLIIVNLRDCHTQSLISWDYWLGKLSYPLFLCHMDIRAIFMAQFPALQDGSFNSAIVFLAASLLFSLILVLTIDIKIDSVRNKYKQHLHQHQNNFLSLKPNQ